MLYFKMTDNIFILHVGKSEVIFIINKGHEGKQFIISSPHFFCHLDDTNGWIQYVEFQDTTLVIYS